jgi:hypothetical protein
MSEDFLLISMSYFSIITSKSFRRQEHFFSLSIQLLFLSKTTCLCVYHYYKINYRKPRSIIFTIKKYVTRENLLYSMRSFHHIIEVSNVTKLYNEMKSSFVTINKIFSFCFCSKEKNCKRNPL